MLLVKNGNEQTEILEKLIAIISEKKFYDEVIKAKDVNDLKNIYN